jgi:ABC-type glycerol-3-phosphate transport system substrate-binding protein
MSIRIIAATVAALGIAGCAMTGTQNAGGAKEMKLAFDFTDGTPPCS